MAETKRGSKKPQDSAFQQQRLEACHPLLTPQLVIGLFLIVGIVFIIIGVVIRAASADVVEVSVRYDDICPTNTSVGYNVPCPVNISIPKKMKAPVYVYYKLTEFYQNHRRYVKSRSDPQLRGENVLSDLSSCDPLESWNKTSLYPCGLIANSYFNDTFVWGNGAGWDETGIAWESDKDVKFKEPTTDVSAHRLGPGGFTLPNVTNEHFIVWMRTAGLPTFRKLYAKIHQDLEKDDVVTLNVTSVFPTKSFGGEKWIVLSTTTWIGGKNDFLGSAYLVVGILCVIFAVFFLAKHLHSPRNPGDMKYFNWRGVKTTVTASS